METAVFYLFLLVLGTSIGSFLNVLIDRIPADEPLGGRSKCDYCGKVLRAFDLVPVLSFLKLGGKSSCCRKELSAYYPFVEMLTGIVFVLIGMTIGPDVVTLVPYLGIASSLIVIFFADVKYRIIPDLMIITLIFFSMPLLFVQSGGSLELVLSRILAGIVLFTGMLAIYAATRGKGMGFGDVKFAFALGFLLGLKMGFFAIYFAFIAGGLLALLLLGLKGNSSKLKNLTLKSKIAFGPFLVAGLIFMYLWGDTVDRFFSGLF